VGLPCGARTARAGVLGFRGESSTHAYALILALCCCLVTRRLGRPELILVAAVLAVGMAQLRSEQLLARSPLRHFWIGGPVEQHDWIEHHRSGHWQFEPPLHRGAPDRQSPWGLFFLAGIGFLRRYANSRMIEALAAVPFLLLTVQNYGGEGLLRVVLYGLPFTSLLAASAILPGSAGTIRAFLPKLRIGRYGRLMLRAAVVVVLFGFCVATTLTRWQ